MTTKITIEEYLASYLRAKYSILTDTQAVNLPDRCDLYHLLWDLMGKRPIDCLIDSGNLELVLPNRREGKNPLYYNYLSTRAVSVLSGRIKQLFDTDFHSSMEEYRSEGMGCIEGVMRFCIKYNIPSSAEDALLKNYYRWRNKISMRSRRRKYDKKVTKNTATKRSILSQMCKNV